MARTEIVSTGLRRLIERRQKHAVALGGAAVAVGLILFSMIPLLGRPPAQQAPAFDGTPAPTAQTANPAAYPSPTPLPVPSDAENAPAVAMLDEEALPSEDDLIGSRPQEAITHVVQDGDTLSGIADLYGVSADSILWANNGVDDPHFLRVGQELIVPPMTGILHTVLDGDTLLHVAALYRAELEEIVEVNSLQPPFLIAIGQMLIVPGGSPPEPPILAMADPQRAEPSTRQSREPDPPPAPVATVVPHPAMTAEGAAFVAQLVGPAQRSQRETGVPASVTIAQAIWEADWGRSGLARRAHNYFGIKGRPTPGPAGVIWLDTWEHINGRNITVKEPFRAYNNLLESVLDHGVFLRSNSRYAEAMKNAHDPRLFIKLVHKAGYATDPAYSDKIIRLMDRYDLYVYDVAG